uniref:Uncharacterized protein n=1 Tax=Nelumbo nucifera TaxID=4432 RepID=A0A822XPD7_NELNU|nr:TPA_asm: hypothetical protein HUJ06_024937 [Nelumbo nucifera]
MILYIQRLVKDKIKMALLIWLTTGWDASKPGGTRMYQLQTVGFPAKQLTDVTQTIDPAGLANSVVIQKFLGQSRSEMN